MIHKDCSTNSRLRYVTKLNASSDQGVYDRWCAGFRTAHGAAFTCSAYRAGDGQLLKNILYAR